MTRSFEVPDDVYARIAEAASANGKSIAEVIASRFPATAVPGTDNNDAAAGAVLENGGES